MKIKFYVAAVVALVVNVGMAQTVTVKKQTEKVKGENADGFTTELPAKISDVSGPWAKFLKEVGRVKLFSSDPVVITDPNFNGTVYPKGLVYAHIFDNGKATRVWLGALSKEWDEKDNDLVSGSLEKLIYQFGIQFNRAQVQSQIDETQRAAEAVDKQKQRLVNQNKELTVQLANNEQEKVQLQKALDNNKLENDVLRIKLEKNKKAQDSLENAGLQIKKVMDTHKEKLRQIN